MPQIAKNEITRSETWGTWAFPRMSRLFVGKLLKTLVGERGFEPPTPWSRNDNLFVKLLIRLGW